MELKEYITEIADFPKKGILFRDICPLMRDPMAWKEAIRDLSSLCTEFKPDLIVGIEARGFIIGAALSTMTGIGFAPIRKQGKLPGETLSLSYELEYGGATLEMQEGEGEVVIVDDVLATGGTLQATNDLAKQAGYTVVGNLVLVDLEYVPRVDNFNLDVRSVIQYG